MDVRVDLVRIIIRETDDQQIIILRERDGEREFPIVIGTYEGLAIDRRVKGVLTPRPMTHDLIKNVLLGLETNVRKVVVSKLKDDTFYALIWLENGGQAIAVDSRPSDALALALRVDCPIFVEEEVLKNSKISSTVGDKISHEGAQKWLENLNEDDMGRYKM